MKILGILPVFLFIVIHAFPQTAKEFNTQGLEKYALKDYELAISEFSKAIALDSTYSDAYLNRGSANFNLAEYALAASDYAKALELGTDVKFIYEYKAKANQYIGNYAQAVIDYSKAIALDSKNYQLYENRANCYHVLEQYDKAIQDYDFVLILLPSHTVTYKNRGHSKSKAHYYKEAEEDFTHLISIENFATHYYSRGYVRYCQKKYSAAIKDFDITIANLDMFYDAHLYRAACYFEKKEFVKAMDDYTALIALKHDEFYFNRGRCKYILKDYSGAISDFTARIKLAPNNPDAHYHRGLAKLKMDDIKSCCEDWSIAAKFGSIEAQKGIKENCN